MHETQAILALIKDRRAFHGLGEGNRRYLAEHSVSKEHRKGDFIWRKQEPGEFCAYLVDGLVEISETSREGDDRVIGVFGPGEVIGLSAILKKTGYPANAIAVSRSCKILKLYIRSLESDLNDSNRHEMQVWLREKLLTHEQMLRDKIMIVGAGKVHTRLIELLEHLRSRFSTSKDLNNFLIPVMISKTQIAKIIQARVETVIRTLNKWEKAGHLKFDTKGVTVSNLAQLKLKLDK